MILFLLFPDKFERIFSTKDREKIVSEFTKEPVKNLSVLEMDQCIFEIRRQKEKEYSTTKLDFYNDPLEKEWKYIKTHFAWTQFYESIAKNCFLTSKTKEMGWLKKYTKSPNRCLLYPALRIHLTAESKVRWKTSAHLQP